MKVHSKLKNPIRLISITLLTAGLVACGGGGSDPAPVGGTGSGGTGGGGTGGGGTGGGGTATAPITKSNYTTVAGFGYGLAGFSGTIAQASGAGVTNNPARSSATKLTSRATTTDPATCVSSGSGSNTSNIAVQGQVSNGDSYSGTFENCRNDNPPPVGGYYLLDGSYTFTYSNVTGNYFFGDVGSVVINGQYNQFSFGGEFPPQPAFSVSFDGHTTYELEKTATTHRLKLTSNNFTFGSTHGSESTTFAMTNINTEVKDNLADGTQTITGGYDIVVTTTPDVFSGSFAVTFDVQGMTASENPSSGTVTIRDKNSAAIIVITVLSETLVQVAFDENGDGTPEETKPFTPEDLGG